MSLFETICTRYPTLNEKKFTLAPFDIEFIGPQNTKHLFKMLFVFLYHFRVNQNIIHNYIHELTQIYTKQGNHQGHKSVRAFVGPKTSIHSHSILAVAEM